MFCYVKYCTSAINNLRESRTERSSKTPIRVKMHPTLKALSSISQISQRASTFINSMMDFELSSSVNTLTKQLTVDKSLLMINKFRTLALQQKAGDSETDLSTVPSDAEKIVASEIEEDVPKKSRFAFRARTNQAATFGQRKNIRFGGKSPRGPRQPRVSYIEPNTTFMINPNCYVQILLDYIYDQLCLDKEVNLDLCDDDGNMIKLFSYNKDYCGKNILQPRKIYYVVTYELNDDGSFMSIDPLFRQEDEEGSALVAKINKHTNIRKQVPHSSSTVLKSSTKRQNKPASHVTDSHRRSSAKSND